MLKSTKRTNMGNSEAAEPVRSEAGMALEAVLALEAGVALDAFQRSAVVEDTYPERMHVEAAVDNCPERVHETAVEFWSGLSLETEVERSNKKKQNQKQEAAGEC